MNNIILVCELDADIDDLIALDYLHLKNALKGVVLDPLPKSNIGKERLEKLKKQNIQFF